MSSIFWADSFFQEISRSFVGKQWTINESTILVFKIVFFVTFLSIILYFFQNSLKKRKAKHSPFIITNPNEIYKILNDSITYRSTFELSFSDVHVFFAKCTPLKLKEDVIVIELPIDATPQPDWIKRKIYIYLTVFHKKRRQFYYFESQILSFYSTEDSNYLEIKIPSLIEIRQKRKHFRIDVSLKDFECIKIYFSKEKKNVINESQLPQSVFEFNKEDYNGLTNLSSLPVSLENISAGGIRLGFSNEFKKIHNFDVNNAPYIIIFMQFYIEEQIKKLFLLCEVKNFAKDYYTGDIELGLQFKKICQVNKENDSFVWTDVNEEEGIDEIAKFVFIKNQELIRKGLTE